MQNINQPIRTMNTRNINIRERGSGNTANESSDAITWMEISPGDYNRICRDDFYNNGYPQVVRDNPSEYKSKEDTCDWLIQMLKKKFLVSGFPRFNFKATEVNDDNMVEDYFNRNSYLYDTFWEWVDNYIYGDGMEKEYNAREEK